MLLNGDPLLIRAEAVINEASRLRVAHQQFHADVLRQVERMKQIEAELDKMLPHPPEELAIVRGILAHETELLKPDTEQQS
ncbi:hypothetical protein [Microvirga zambiensis]|uniref:hypothetical protein n=1 Tax=Microvirga zambiensis TaxID=1402137 RepID=UPI00191EFC17|nr:hypothetical protein [Microvirga zambiensis]